jgi:uncharacterized coiled-coil protein SlyX
MRKVLLTIGLLLSGASVWAWQDANATPLGQAAEKARREREARKGQKAVKAYTEADLRGAGATASSSEASASGAAAPDASASPAPGAKKEKTDDEVRADKKKDLEKRIAEQLKLIDVIRKAMDEAQAELGDPTTATTFGSRGAALQKRITDGEAELAKTQQAIADIEDEARRQGISVSH